MYNVSKSTKRRRLNATVKEIYSQQNESSESEPNLHSSVCRNFTRGHTSSSYYLPTSSSWPKHVETSQSQIVPSTCSNFVSSDINVQLPTRANAELYIN